MDITYSAQIYAKDTDVVTAGFTESQLALLSSKGMSGASYKIVKLSSKLMPLAIDNIATNLLDIELISVIADKPLSLTIESNVTVGEESIIKNTSKFNTGDFILTSLSDTEITNVNLVIVGNI